MADPAVESIIPALSNRVRLLMKQQGVPGAALGIVRNQALVWSAGFGYADLAAARPLDETTLFGVASITKTFTGLAIMQLRDLGKLALDDPVVGHIPEFKAVRNRYGRPEDVTIRRLLTHRSGLVGEPPTGHWSSMQFFADYMQAEMPDPAVNGYAAAAGLRTSVADLARWAALQFRTKTKERANAQVLAGKSLGEMHRVTYVEPDWKTGYAMPWIGVRIGENIYFTHSGSVPGFLSTLAFGKPHRIAVIVLTNKQGHSVAGAIAFEALEMLTSRVAKETPARAGPPAAAPPEWKPLLGRYVGELTWGMILHIEYRNGALLLVVPADPYLAPPQPPARLTPTDKLEVFIVSAGRPAGEALVFEFGGDGSVVAFVIGENGGRFRKTD